MSIRRDQRLRRVARLLASAPPRPEAIDAALDAFHATGEVPSDARLAACVLARIERNPVHEHVNLATGIRRLLELVDSFEAGEEFDASATVSTSRLYEAVHGTQGELLGPPVPDTPTLMREFRQLGDLARELGVLDNDAAPF